MPNRLATLPEFQGASAFTPRPSAFQHGLIVSVDAERWVVTVELHESGSRLYDIPVMQPYFYHERGQGMYSVPEVGAQCIVSDAGGHYFVVGFLPPVDPAVNDPKLAGEDLSKTYDQQTGGNVPQNSAQTSYRNGRDGDMLPGDYCFTTRARNRIKMFTNGNVIIQASRICSRIYSKLRNMISDVCLNFRMMTPGGEHNWINDADDGSVAYDRQVKVNVADDEPSFVEEIGAKGGVVNRRVQTSSGSEVFSEQLNPDGSAELSFVAGAHEVNVDADKIEVKALSGTHTVTIDATGVHIVTAGGFDVTAANGTMAINELGGQWNVIGDLTLTATGNMYLQPVGALYLPE